MYIRYICSKIESSFSAKGVNDFPFTDIFYSTDIILLTGLKNEKGTHQHNIRKTLFRALSQRYFTAPNKNALYIII